MEAPICKLCGHRHWGTMDHIGFEVDVQPEWKYRGRIVYKPHFVYGLIDPRTGVVFYIGVTTHVKRRMAAHQSPASADTNAHARCMEIRATGARVEHKIYGEYLNSIEGRWAERELILTLPGLVNSVRHDNRGGMSVELYPLSLGSGRAALEQEQDFLTRYYGSAA